MASNGKEHRSGQFGDPATVSPGNSPRRLTNQLLAWCRANAAKEESRSEAATSGTVPGTYSGQQQSNASQDINGHQQIEQSPSQTTAVWRGRGNMKDQPQVSGLPLMAKLRPPLAQQFGHGYNSLNGQVNIYPQHPQLVNGQTRIDPWQPQEMIEYQQANGYIKLDSNPRQEMKGGPKDGPKPPQQINGPSGMQTRIIYGLELGVTGIYCTCQAQRGLMYRIDFPAPPQPEVAIPKPGTGVYVPPQRRKGGGNIHYQSPPDPEMPHRFANFHQFRDDHEHRTQISTPAEKDDNWRQRK